ncbi:MAG: BatA domain-containing protein, partial [Thalassospira sp.]|nr:BatA domain-containing protein [Thalassospira sp.]
MGIEWLNPAALLGLLALPVLYWLSRQQPKPPTEQPFAGVVLLQPPPHSVPPPVRTALWRLLCRAGFVAALILAAAQPQQPAPQLALPAGQKTLVLLDNTLWATPAAAFIQEQLTVLTRMAGEQGHSLVVRGLAPTTDGQLPEATAALRAQPFDTLSRAETGDYSRVVVFSSGWMSRASVDFLKTLTPPVEIIAAPVQSRAQWRLLTDKIALMGKGALSDNPPVAVNGADGLRLPGIQGLWSWNPQQKSAPPRLGLIDMGSAAPLSNLSDAVPYLETAAKQFGGFSRGAPSRLVAEGVSLFLWPGSIVLDDAEL